MDLPRLLEIRNGEKVKGTFTVRTSEVPTTVLSRASLPADPQVLVLPGF